MNNQISLSLTLQARDLADTISRVQNDRLAYRERIDSYLDARVALDRFEDSLIQMVGPPPRFFRKTERRDGPEPLAVDKLVQLVKENENLLLSSKSAASPHRRQIAINLSLAALQFRAHILNAGDQFTSKPTSEEHREIATGAQPLPQRRNRGPRPPGQD